MPRLVALREQRLNDADASDAEAIRRRGHVEAPDPVRDVARQRSRLRLVGFETTHPLAERRDVMLAETLDVAKLEPRALSGGDHGRRRNEIAVREHVAPNELIA